MANNSDEKKTGLEWKSDYNSCNIDNSYKYMFVETPFKINNTKIQYILNKNAEKLPNVGLPSTHLGCRFLALLSVQGEVADHGLVKGGDWSM